MPELYVPETELAQGYQPDELPTIRDLSSDFEYLLDGCHYTKLRLLTALDYSGYLKDHFEPGEYSINTYSYAKDQILPRLFLDTMVLTARREVYQTSSRGAGGESTLPLIRGLIQAKVDVQKDISDYIIFNPESSSMVLYHNLALIMHHSRKILYGDDVTDQRSKRSNLAQLSGILAEYKVLSALTEEWPQVSFGSVDEDRMGADIVIPARTRPGRAAVLQIKSSQHPKCEMEISMQEAEIPVLVVPMNTSKHDPLRLSEEHSRFLRNYVTYAPKLQLARVA